MRSDLVFKASGHVKNRYFLCHLVRVSSRKFHKTGVPIQETISKVFGLVSDQAFGKATVETRTAWELSFNSGRAVAEQNLRSLEYREQAEIERAG